jgi:hypothetical protein
VLPDSRYNTLQLGCSSSGTVDHVTLDARIHAAATLCGLVRDSIPTTVMMRFDVAPLMTVYLLSAQV